MPEDILKKLRELDNPNFLRLAWGGGAILLILAIWVFWHFIYTNPEHVFWDTISNNLALNGVTKHTTSSQNNSQLDQTEQISLGANNLAHMHSSISQTVSGQKSTVRTETIATPTVNYNRYIVIQTTQKNKAGHSLDFSAAIGRWSRQAVSPATQGAFAQAIYDVIPFGRLNAGQRQTIIKNMQQNQVYSTDFNQVGHKKVDGQSVYEYQVKVAPAAFVSMLKQLDQKMGLKQLSSVDPSQYQGSAQFDITVDINPFSHQLVQLKNNGQTEDFSAYGLGTNIQPPTKSIPQASLQSQLSQILNTP